METLGKAFTPPSQGSTTNSESSTNRLPTSTCHQSQQNSIAHANYATSRAKILFGQYRRGDANDPDTYVAGVAAVLAEYPPETIRYVTDPRTGIAANPLADPDTGRVWTGMPDLANVKRACEIHYAPTRQLIARNRQAQEDQKRREEEVRREADRPSRPTYQELVESCAREGLIIGKHRNKPMMAPLSQEAFCKQFGIDAATFASLPDQPKA
jgi:hypothetical protein